MKHILFGESHGNAIGITLENPPPGIRLDWDFIRAEMARRAPGQSNLTTTRREADEIEILSGVFEGKTTGTPLCAIIRNTDAHEADYRLLKDLPRPSHADYTAALRYGTHADYRGGGHFSGRLTAPLVFAGALAKLILRERGIDVAAAISMIGGVKDPSEQEIAAIIEKVRQEKDSGGGAIRGSVMGLPPGCGSPDFGLNAEGIFAQYFFAVPAVKAVSFGAGFGFASLRGSEANDAFLLENGDIRTATNHSGGINGGITNGMPLTFEVAFRPTPSIGRPQKTVSLSRREETELTIPGRHDPCIVLRAVVVIEAAAALAACELLGI